MRQLLVMILLLAANQVFAQIKGVEPEETPAESASGTTWALIVGISEYSNPNIPKLKYAHRDAQAFADYLRSPAGGSLDNDHLQWLVNEQATLANVWAALLTLVEQAREGDQVVIYFSGHGDVETKLMNKPGYLLCWDASAHAYGAGGCLNVRDLQDFVSTYIGINKTKVLLITDACHAGKLAGSAIGGTAITSTNLAKPIATETKILSCQSNELSLEGPQWGNGRGLFSYHLVDGLLGLADRDNDLTVTLAELNRYLEDNVPEDAKPHKQNPVILGDRTEKVASVDPEIREKRLREKTAQQPVLAAVDSRGVEDKVLAGVDSSTRKAYFTFKSALETKQFFQPKNTCAEDLYTRLSADTRLAPLHGFMKRNYAAALQDETQKAINDYLTADPSELRKRWSYDQRYNQFPAYLKRAAELLRDHPSLYTVLKTREYYFTGLNLRLRGEREKDKSLFPPAIELQYQVLQLDSSAAFAYNELGLLEWRLGKDKQAPVEYFKQAIAHAPEWVFPWANLCAYNVDHLSAYSDGVTAGIEAVRLDSTLAMAHNNLGRAYFALAKWPQAIDYFQKAILNDSLYDIAYYNLGLTYVMQGDFVRAEQMWTIYHQRSPGDIVGVVDLGEVSLYLGKKEKALQLYRKALDIDPNYFPANLKIGEYFLGEKQYVEAAAAFTRLTKIQPDSPVGYYWMAYTESFQNQEEKAANHLKTAVGMDKDFKMLRESSRLENLRTQAGFVAFMERYFPEWKG